MDYSAKIDIFPTVNEYQFKFPNYFKNQEHIQKDTQLKDFYYEIFNEHNKVFRISFEKL